MKHSLESSVKRKAPQGTDINILHGLRSAPTSEPMNHILCPVSKPGNRIFLQTHVHPDSPKILFVEELLSACFELIYVGRRLSASQSMLRIILWILSVAKGKATFEAHILRNEHSLGEKKSLRNVLGSAPHRLG